MVDPGFTKGGHKILDLLSLLPHIYKINKTTRWEVEGGCRAILLYGSEQQNNCAIKLLATNVATSSPFLRWSKNNFYLQTNPLFSEPQQHSTEDFTFPFRVLRVLLKARYKGRDQKIVVHYECAGQFQLWNLFRALTQE